MPTKPKTYSNKIATSNEVNQSKLIEIVQKQRKD